MSCKESTSHSPHGSTSDAEPSLEFTTEESRPANQISPEVPPAAQPVPTSASTPESVTETTEFTEEPSVESKEEKEGMLSLLVILFCLNEQNSVLIAPHSAHFSGEFKLFFVSTFFFFYWSALKYLKDTCCENAILIGITHYFDLLSSFKLL